MLKSCFLPIQYDRLLSKTCGEIVCQSETSFTIICKFCDIKMFEFNEFLQHIHGTHWLKTSTAEDISEKFCENNKVFADKNNDNKILESDVFEKYQIVCEEYHLNDTVDDQDEWTPDRYMDYYEDEKIDNEPLSILKKVSKLLYKARLKLT